jgi:3-phosphoshikimate 1-carboxyvinyltransferase
MRADIQGNGDGEYAPLKIKKADLSGIEYHMPVASAQVKSSLLLASLYAKGSTCIHEPCVSRNHTELMLNSFGADIVTEGHKITSGPVDSLYSQKIVVPGDISSAAYFMVAATIIPGSHIEVKGVGVNPTRTGILDALTAMGASIEMNNTYMQGGEMVADVSVYSSRLKGIEISGELIPRLIDEIPAICVAAVFAEGFQAVHSSPSDHL